MLAMNHEGKDWAGFFNNMGIAAIVLKYRMPNGNLEVPISDAEAAMRLVKANASRWHIDPGRRGHYGLFGGRTFGIYYRNPQQGRRQTGLSSALLWFIPE